MSDPGVTDDELGKSIIDIAMEEGSKLREAAMRRGLALSTATAVGCLWLAASILSHPDAQRPPEGKTWGNFLDFLIRAYRHAHVEEEKEPS